LEQLDFEFPGIDVHAVDDISIHYFKAYCHLQFIPVKYWRADVQPVILFMAAQLATG